MGLLGAAVYDPATLATKSTASLLAMTALDTTNLRVTFTAPSSGNVLVRIRTASKGSATIPQIMLGVLDGATVKLRIVPFTSVRSIFSAGTLPHEAVGIVTGLTGGNSYTWDAAYGVEEVVASTQLGWGGPNDTTSDNGYGATVFEVWDAPNLLAGVMYDPATAVAKSCTAGLAMTALDTTNLRLTFTAPSSGNVLVRLRGVVSGSSSGMPSIYLGVLESSTIKGRVAALGNTNQGGTLTVNDRQPMESLFVVTGLSAGSHTWDAAYGVEDPRASNNLQYGGPDNTTAGDAWGGFAFEIWDAS